MPRRSGRAPDPQWIEDRFWIWIHYGATKAGRGEVLECHDMLAALRRDVLGPLIAEARGHRPGGVRRLERIAPDLVPALEATLGDATAAGCLRAMEATAALYRRLRDDTPHPGLVRRAEAQTAALDYLGAIAARVARAVRRGPVRNAGGSAARRGTRDARWTAACAVSDRAVRRPVTRFRRAHRPRHARRLRHTSSTSRTLAVR